MRRALLVAMVTAALLVFTAGPAFATHCVNLSKADGAGNHTTVVVDATTEEVVSISGLNGGFADVWLDVDGDGTGDLLVAEDVMIGKQHSPNVVGEWVNPGAIAKAANPNATDDHGMGFPPEH